MSEAETAGRTGQRTVFKRGTRRANFIVQLVPILLALLLALVYFTLSRPGGSGVLLGLDDGYIHARLGQNLARTGVLGINPGEGGGGSSSLLWTALLTFLAFWHIPADVAALLLGFASLGGMVWAVCRLARRYVGPWGAFAVGLFIALGGQHLALALSGMETLLLTALLFTGFALEAEGHRKGSLAAFALAALTRPEAILAPFAIAVARSLPSRDAPNEAALHPMKVWVRAGIVLLVAAAGIGLLALLGHGLPSTVGGRRWLYGLGEKPFTTLGPALPILFRFIQLNVNRLVGMTGPGGVFGWIWALLVAELAITGMVGLWRRGALARGILLWAVLHLLFTFGVLGEEGHLGRYLEPLWALLPLLAVVGWTATIGAVPDRVGRGVAFAATVLLMAGYLPQAFAWSGWYGGAVHHLKALHLRMARSVAQMVPRDQPVAGFDIGLLSWRSGHRIVDIGGLGGWRMVDAMYHRRVPELLDSLGVQYVVLPETRTPRLRYLFANRLGFDPDALSPRARYLLGPKELGHLATTRVAMPAQTLYYLGPVGGTDIPADHSRISSQADSLRAGHQE